ncbi:MAG TPA: hypothetical protein VMS17_18435, partial [Gemmataceae bacterium]|nr:hypothetical protein [Gemmataceae bacterium]
LGVGHELVTAGGKAAFHPRLLQRIPFSERALYGITWVRSSKGLSRIKQANPQPGASNDSRIVPDVDKTFVNELSSWAFDFSAQRVRKECQLTGCYTSKEAFFMNKSLNLFFDGKYKQFHPKDSYPKADDQAFAPDVVLYEDASHSFLLEFTDFPLLWPAGNVSGKYPKPEEMQYLESPDHFSWRGEAQREGHDCVVLTTQEQASPTAVREFWIGTKEPYPIYYCRARNGDKAYWQLEVQYDDQRRLSLPTKWTFTEYSRVGTSFMSRVYTVRDMEINKQLTAELFQKKLEPGQTVLDVENHKKLEVDSSGALVPFNPVRQSTNTLSIVLWSLLGLAVLGLLAFFAWRYHRRRSTP